MTARFRLGPFTPHDGKPVLRPHGSSWESANLSNPAAAVVRDQVVLLCRAHGEDLVSRTGLATSGDGRAFARDADRARARARSRDYQPTGKTRYPSRKAEKTEP